MSYVITSVFLLPPQSIMLIVKAGNRHIQYIKTEKRKILRSKSNIFDQDYILFRICTIADKTI